MDLPRNSRLIKTVSRGSLKDKRHKQKGKNHSETSRKCIIRQTRLKQGFTYNDTGELKKKQRISESTKSKV